MQGQCQASPGLSTEERSQAVSFWPRRQRFKTHNQEAASQDHRRFPKLVESQNTNGKGGQVGFLGGNFLAFQALQQHWAVWP